MTIRAQGHPDDERDRALRVDEERLDREREQLRRDEVTPESAPRVLTVPVLLGGAGNGMPVSWEVQSVQFLHFAAGADSPDSYRARKFVPPGAQVALRFAALESLSLPDALALAWDWLLATAFEVPWSGDA